MTNPPTTAAKSEAAAVDPTRARLDGHLHEVTTDNLTDVGHAFLELLHRLADTHGFVHMMTSLPQPRDLNLANFRPAEHPRTYLIAADNRDATPGSPESYKPIVIHPGCWYSLTPTRAVLMAHSGIEYTMYFEAPPSIV
jgi:hypothetical protein